MKEVKEEGAGKDGAAISPEGWRRGSNAIMRRGFRQHLTFDALLSALPRWKELRVAISKMRS